MPRKLFHLSWKDFDAAVEFIAKQVRPTACGVYGVPRGGLPLAVALCHRLELPYLDKPKNNAIIVDDIVDSGQTMQSFRQDNIQLVALVTLQRDFDGIAPYYFDNKPWVIFPWENTQKAQQDMEQYLCRPTQ